MFPITLQNILFMLVVLLAVLLVIVSSKYLKSILENNTLATMVTEMQERICLAESTIAELKCKCDSIPYPTYENGEKWLVGDRVSFKTIVGNTTREGYIVPCEGLLKEGANPLCIRDEDTTDGARDFTKEQVQDLRLLWRIGD